MNSPSPQGSTRETEPVVPGRVNSAVTALCIGLLTGFTGTMYQAYIWYVSDSFYLPWGALLAVLLVYMGATWTSLRASQNWAGTLAGVLAFLVTVVFAYAKSGSVLVLANPVVPVGVAGTIWMLGTLAATIASNITVSRYYRRR